MISVSKLVCGQRERSDELRYYSGHRKPIVVWNMSRRCNLRCVHCYAEATKKVGADDLTTEEAKTMIDDLAKFGVPVLLFSGGEPVMRHDLPELAFYARGKGIRTVISTNGTLISKQKAKTFAKIGLSYVGVSLDGMKETNDKFRGADGCFDAALRGIRNCQDEGIKVGLRFTMNKRNVQDLEGIFELLEQEKIQRACFYHLVYSGRGTSLVDEDLSHDETRDALDLIIDHTKAVFAVGEKKEILTVDNHADGPYVYTRVLQQDPERAPRVLELLELNEGNSSGIGISCVSWDGSVHADQFWRQHTFGNVRQRKFSEIWTDTGNPIMAGLKERKPLLKGRCAKCKWLSICNGNFRARAEAVCADPWASDPACYLTAEEIGVSQSDDWFCPSEPAKI